MCNQPPNYKAEKTKFELAHYPVNAYGVHGVVPLYDYSYEVSVRESFSLRILRFIFTAASQLNHPTSLQ